MHLPYAGRSERLALPLGEHVLRCEPPRSSRTTRIAASGESGEAPAAEGERAPAGACPRSQGGASPSMYEAIWPSFRGRPFISPNVLSIASAVRFALSISRSARLPACSSSVRLASNGPSYGLRRHGKRSRSEAALVARGGLDAKWVGGASLSLALRLADGSGAPRASTPPGGMTARRLGRHGPQYNVPPHCSSD
jgi:hypothetical protein